MKTLTPTLAVFALLLGAPLTAFAGPGAWHRVSDGKVEEIPGGAMLNERLDQHVDNARDDIDRAKELREAERARLKDARRHRRQMRAESAAAALVVAGARRWRRPGALIAHGQGGQVVGPGPELALPARPARWWPTMVEVRRRAEEARASGLAFIGCLIRKVGMRLARDRAFAVRVLHPAA